MTATGDIEVKLPNVYTGLDVAHTPRLIVPEHYIEQRTWKLQRLAAFALLDSQKFPDTQFDVVWLGTHVGRFLRAEIQPSGKWGGSFGIPIKGTDETFRSDPGVIEQWPGSFTYVGRIEKALENGAGIFKPADLGPSDGQWQ